MQKLQSIITLSLLPLQAIAQDKPSMTSMWIELLFLIVMLFSLKIAHFSIKNKFILFSVYILLGITTQTIWFPVLIFVGLYYVFTQSNSDDDPYS